MKRTKMKRAGKTTQKSADPKAAGVVHEVVHIDRGKLVREIARERVGQVKSSRLIEKKPRRNPKHKPPAGELPPEG